MSDFKERMYEEHRQLVQRLENLRDFIISEEFKELPKDDRDDILDQLFHMTEYFTVLTKRLSRLATSGDEGN